VLPNSFSHKNDTSSFRLVQSTVTSIVMSLQRLTSSFGTNCCVILSRRYIAFSGRCVTFNYPLFGAFQKLRKSTIIFVTSLFLLSVCLHETTRLPLEEFLRNLIFEYFSKISSEYSRFIEVWRE
jgi:hypothetical protein